MKTFGICLIVYCSMSIILCAFGIIFHIGSVSGWLICGITNLCCLLLNISLFRTNLKINKLREQLGLRSSITPEKHAEGRRIIYQWFCEKRPINYLKINKYEKTDIGRTQKLKLPKKGT